MKKTPIIISILMCVISLLPMGVFATTQTSTNGYTLNGQVNAITGINSGGIYTSQSSSNPVSQLITSINGYSLYGGGYFTSNVSLCNTVGANNIGQPLPCTFSSGGGTGGGGGGGSSTPVTPVITKPVSLINDQRTFSEIVAATPKGSAPYRADPFPDGKIDLLDFNSLMVHWNKTVGDPNNKKCDSTKITSDINCDSRVDILDFNLLMVYWGRIISK